LARATRLSLQAPSPHLHCSHTVATMGAQRILLLAMVALASSSAIAAEQKAAANPIRKVVTMLQAMQTKVSEEGEKEKEMFDKFQCYCKNSGSTLGESIAAAEAKAPNVGSAIKEAEEKKTGLEAGLKQDKADRAAAKSAMEDATAQREKEAAAFAAEKSEQDADMAAVSKAVAALEKGMTGFLQTGAGQVLKQLVLGNKQDMLLDEDRQVLLSFLSASQGTNYAPQSGQITGILKELGDEMARSLAEATATEEAAIKNYEELMAAKTKEVEALIAAIESKTKKIGELAVEIVELKDDLSDTEAALLEDKKFLAELEKGCATAASEHDEHMKTRSEELVALADTIKVLNDDDALDLFKSTLPSPTASFMQIQGSTAAVRARALAAVHKAARGVDRSLRPRLDLLALALNGKKGGFEKVVTMIDGMVDLLKKEQVEDDNKKEYCLMQLDTTDDKKKGLERTLSDEEAAIAAATEGIATLKEEIAALEAGVAALDKSVAEATEQRKEENKAFTELMASDSAAKELLGFAKNRLNKFYNPALYKPPPKRELTREDRIVVNLGGTAPPTPPPGGIADTGVTVFAQVFAHSQRKEAPPPPPETFGAYSKKTDEGTGVIAMIDLLVKDLDKEMTEAETGEKDAQGDYETMMKDSAEKRTLDLKSIAHKGETKAAMEADLEEHSTAKASAKKELAATLAYIQSLHSECDWLMQYFEVRKKARAGEIDSLVDAKAVLSGSDYSLMQTKRRSFLARSSR